MNRRKTLERLLTTQANVRFSDFVSVLEGFEFHLLRQSGSHRIYTHRQTGVLINLQEVQGEAKPYQIRQFLKLVERYNLAMRVEE